MAKKMEEAFYDWPTTKVMDGSVRLTGKYEHPGLAQKVLAVWVLFWLIAAFPIFPISIVIACCYPLVKPTLLKQFGKKLDIEFFTDRIRLRSGWGYKDYASNIAMEFRVEQHHKAIDEELAESRTGKRKPRTYREAVEAVMQYGEKRVVIAEFPIKQLERANALVLRLQALSRRRPPPPKVKGKPQITVLPGNKDGDFGPEPTIR